MKFECFDYPHSLYEFLEGRDVLVEYDLEEGDIIYTVYAVDEHGGKETIDHLLNADEHEYFLEKCRDEEDRICKEIMLEYGIDRLADEIMSQEYICNGKDLVKQMEKLR